MDREKFALNAESLDIFKVVRTTGLTVGAIERLSSYVNVIRQSDSKQEAPIQMTLEKYIWSEA